MLRPMGQLEAFVNTISMETTSPVTSTATNAPHMEAQPVAPAPEAMEEEDDKGTDKPEVRTEDFSFSPE